MTALSKEQGNVAVFLDRDGVLIEERRLYNDYLTDPNKLRLLPGAPEAVRKLNDAGLPAIVITNQAAIARGIINEQKLHLIHSRMEDMLLEAAGARLDKIYYCPNHPEGVVAAYTGHSESRKPGPGMLLEAARDFSLDLSCCFLVGDQESDILAGQKVRCKTLAVSTEPYGVNWRSWTQAKPDFVAKDLASAVTWILDAVSQTS